MKSDTGPFAIIPEWVLDLAVSDRSVRLYGLLARYADDATGECWPSRGTLAGRLCCSLDSLDRAKGELVAAGALEWEQRENASNVYRLIRVAPQSVDEPGDNQGGVAAPVRLGGRKAAAGGSRTGAAQNENQLNQNQGRARKRAHAPSKDYQPTDSQCAFAKAHSIDITDELEGWLTWCEAEGRTYVDPTAGFSTWLRRARPRAPAAGGVAVGRRPDPRMCSTCANTNRYFNAAGDLVECDHKEGDNDG